MLRQASSAGPLTLSQSSSYVRVVLRVSKSYKRSPVTSTSSSPPDLYHFKQVKKTNVALWLYDRIYWSIKISYVTPLSESLHIRQHRIWARSLGSEFHWLWIVLTTHHVYRVSRYLYIYTVYTCVYSIIITYVIEWKFNGKTVISLLLCEHLQTVAPARLRCSHSVRSLVGGEVWQWSLWLSCEPWIPCPYLFLMLWYSYTVKKGQLPFF